MVLYQFIVRYCQQGLYISESLVSVFESPSLSLVQSDISAALHARLMTSGKGGSVFVTGRHSPSEICQPYPRGDGCCFIS